MRTELTAAQLADARLAAGPGWWVEIPMAGRAPVTGILQEARAWEGGGAVLVTVQLTRNGGHRSRHLLAGADPVIVLGVPD